MDSNRVDSLVFVKFSSSSSFGSSICIYLKNELSD